MAIRAEQLAKAIEIAREFGATRLLIFGSAAHDPNHARDLDLACDGVAGWRLDELGAP
jgi:predicted nucleotidyltransferase